MWAESLSHSVNSDCGQQHLSMILIKYYRIESQIFIKVLDDATSIIIPDSVTEIGEYAFDHNELTDELEIPESVIKIGISAFTNNNLFSVKMSETLFKSHKDHFINIFDYDIIYIVNGVLYKLIDGDWHIVSG